MVDVITFGEAMIRLSPLDFKRIEQADILNMNAGGAEWNVAVDLARLGINSSWISILPDSPLGKFIRNKAREQGVDTSNIFFVKDGRAGIYFVEFGSSPRPSKVIYDRANSAISKIKPGDIDWENIFSGAKWFHTSGITPALSKNCAKVVEEAIKKAKDMGLFVSYDLNYRGKLWTPEEAKKTTERFIEYVDFCIGNEEDAEKVLGIKIKADKNFTKIDKKSYIEVAEAMIKRYKFKYVATSLRESVSVLRNLWSGMLYVEGKPYFSKKYEIEVVDRLGGGDSFSAGLIYSLIYKKSYHEAVDFAAAFSALKQTIPTDTNWATLEEVESLLKDGGTRIKR
ncbi:MAG: sugar kinase [Candidatus Omnitrophica bacterium]|nr:sugar kinase [Candidatus Omnitrophota bacterium]